METKKLYDEYLITSMVAGFDPVEIESASGVANPLHDRRRPTWIASAESPSAMRATVTRR